MSAHDRIFDAVFPPPSELDIPTPSATPLLGSSLFGQPFGSAPVPRPSIETSASRQIEWDRAWHTATAYLSLKDEAIETSESEDVLRKKWVKPLNGEVRRALEYVLLDEESEAEVEGGVKDDLLRWYFEEVVVTHYVKHVRPELVEVSGDIGPTLFVLLGLHRLVDLGTRRETGCASRRCGDTSSCPSDLFTST